jgi:outer membrane protein assembly factor BamB
MPHKHLAVIAVTLALVLSSLVCKKLPTGSPPDAPLTPMGVSNGGYNTTYEFKSAASDSDGDSVALRFNWGDGATSDWSAWVASGETVLMTHLWASPGTYQVKAQAKDRPGLESEWSATLAVAITATRAPGTPGTPVGPTSANKDSLCTYSTIASDPDGEGVSYRFDWGDGDTSDWTAWVSSGTPCSLAHAYGRSGNYGVRSQARDVNEAYSVWSNALQVSIINPFPPTTATAPQGPSAARPNVACSFTSSSYDAGGDSIAIRFSWGDGDTSSWSPLVQSGEPVEMSHSWQDSGAFDIRAQACDEDGAVSVWSAAREISIQNSAPHSPSSPLGPSNGLTDSIYQFTSSTTDPDGDSIAIRFSWGNGDTSDWSSLVPSGELVSMTHSWSAAGVFSVQSQAKDCDGALSAWSDSLRINVLDRGRVRWYWWDTERWPLVTMPVLCFDGTDTIICSSCHDDFYFYALKVNSVGFGEVAARAQTKYASTEETWFSGHAAYLAQYDHVIIGSDEGELYALKGADLSRKWNWPDSSVNGYTGDEFGPACISGAKIYCGRDESLGAIYYFLDQGDAGVVVAGGPYMLTSDVIDAPILDDAGSVIFATDSGYLYKMTDVLNAVIWRLSFPGARRIYSPVLAGGTVYCASDANRLYSINPTTSPPTTNWSYALDGVGMRPVVGQNIFIGTATGTLYAIRTGGTLVWSVTLSDAIYTSPILVTGGLIYVQTDDDKLHCIRQSDGGIEWTCDCSAVLPPGAGRVRRLGNADIRPSPTITGRGNVIVVGARATYCVVGDPANLLDASAAWPKWMKNVYNTGR